jgi:hypothetical protein
MAARQFGRYWGHSGHRPKIGRAQEMAGRNARFEVEQIEQLAPIELLPTHH